MKKFISLGILFLIPILVFPQASPEEYLSKIPQLPNNACSLTDKQKEEFLDKVDKLDKELTAKIEMMENSAHSEYSNYSDQIKQNMANEYGITNEEMQKLSNNTMTEDKKKALSDRIMKQKYDLSMQDVESVKNMTPEQKKAWAAAYGAKRVANARADGYNKAEIASDKEYIELVNEQKSLMEKISEKDNDFINKMKKLNEMKSDASKELDAKTESLRKELSTINDGEGSTEADMKHRQAIFDKIKVIENEYCNKITPDFYNILDERLASIKQLFPDYKKLEEVNNKVDQHAAGVNVKLASPGLMQLKVLENYLDHLRSAFNYTFYYQY